MKSLAFALLATFLCSISLYGLEVQTSTAPAKPKSSVRENLLTRIIKKKLKRLSKKHHRSRQKISNLTSIDCDTLILESGQKLPVTNVEIYRDEIRYQPCGDTENNWHLLKKEKVSLIKYSNGRIEDIHSVPAEKMVTHSKKSARQKIILGSILLLSSVPIGYTLVAFGYLASSNVLMLLGVLLGLSMLVFGVILIIKGLKRKKP